MDFFGDQSTGVRKVESILAAFIGYSGDKYCIILKLLFTRLTCKFKIKSEAMDRLISPSKINFPSMTDRPGHPHNWILSAWRITVVMSLFCLIIILMAVWMIQVVFDNFGYAAMLQSAVIFFLPFKAFLLLNGIMTTNIKQFKTDI